MGELGWRQASRLDCIPSVRPSRVDKPVWTNLPAHRALQTSVDGRVRKFLGLVLVLAIFSKYTGHRGWRKGGGAM